MNERGNQENLPGEESLDGKSRELDINEIPETDIIFDCPHCGKSLSIDQKGAGLVVRCTQCGNLVSVPIPAGMELEDFDASPEELSSQLLRTRQVLARVQAERDHLEVEVLSLRKFREDTELFFENREEGAQTLLKLLSELLTQQRQSLDKMQELAHLAASILSDPDADGDEAGKEE